MRWKSWNASRIHLFLPIAAFHPTELLRHYEQIFFYSLSIEVIAFRFSYIFVNKLGVNDESKKMLTHSSRNSLHLYP